MCCVCGCDTYSTACVCVASDNVLAFGGAISLCMCSSVRVLCVNHDVVGCVRMCEALRAIALRVYKVLFTPRDVLWGVNIIMMSVGSVVGGEDIVMALWCRCVESAVYCPLVVVML